MAKKSSVPFLATEFNYPDPSAKAKPASEVSFGASKAGSGSVDPIKGAGVDNFTPVNSASNSPVKGDGFSDGGFAGRGDKPRSEVSYG